jgi:predicted Zn-dependent protease
MSKAKEKGQKRLSLFKFYPTFLIFKKLINNIINYSKMDFNEANSEILRILDSDRSKIVDGRVVLEDIYPKSKIEPQKDDDIISLLKYKQRLSSVQGPYNPFLRFKPIFIVTDKQMSERHLRIIIEGLEDILDTIDLKGVLPIHEFRGWNQGNGPHQSVDWYIERAFNPDRKDFDINHKGQCDIVQLTNDLRNEPLQKKIPHYDVFALSGYDLYHTSGYKKLNFLIGVGGGNQTILSILRFKDSGDEVIKTGAMHEFGHSFPNLFHCGNGVEDGTPGECLMKFPNNIPHDLEVQTDYRLNNPSPFCDKHTFERYKLGVGKMHNNKFPELKNLYDKIYSGDSIVPEIINSGRLAKLETKLTFV